MDFLVLAVLILLIFAVAALAFGVWRLLGQVPQPLESSALVPASNGLGDGASGSTSPAVRVDPVDDRHVELSVDDQLLATIVFDPEPRPGPDRGPGGVVPANDDLVAVVLELARSAPHAFKGFGASSGWTVTFSKETMQGLKDGTLRLMTGGRAIVVDAATGKTTEIGTVTTMGVARGTAAWPMLFAGGAAVAAAALQQQQLGSVLEAIHAGIGELHQRHVDDTSGVLFGGAELAREVVAASQRGEIPRQIARELAVARRDVDAVYFARRQRIRRFIDEVERAQDAHEERSGERAAWSASVEAAFGDPVQFHADALAFVQAAAIKAHLAAGTAALIASEGRPDYAFGLLSRTEQLLREDVFDLRRRLVALATFTPEGRRNRELRQSAHDVSTRLFHELEQRIEPLLPLQPTDTITVSIDSGAVAAGLSDSSRWPNRLESPITPAR